MPHKAYDLGILADKLRKRKDFKPLVQAIRDVIDFHSAHSDLLYAKDASDQLERLKDMFPEGPASCEAISQALIMNMIVLYARATKTAHASRKTFDLRTRFDAQEKIAHKQICDLRDEAFAHFGTGGTYRGVRPVRETAYMKPVPGDMKFGVLSRRLTYDPELARLLSAQIASAIQVMETEKVRKQDAVVDILIQHSENAEVRGILHQCPLNASAFLGSPGASRRFYKAPIQDLRREAITISWPDNDRWLAERNE